jgi:membrane-associated phospholipid phosphatase
MENHLPRWGTAFVVTVVAVAAAYAFLDRPIAFFSHEHLAQYRKWFDIPTHIPDALWALAGIGLVIGGGYLLADRPLPRPVAVWLTCGVSLIVASWVKDQLKYAFGRTWPETWTKPPNPSLIGDNVFGFNPFHGGQAYSSFPSGHTTYVCSVMMVLWLCYPRFRVVYALLIAALVIGLIGADYHFLSDAIAGGFLGSLVAWLAVKLWDAPKPRLCDLPGRMASGGEASRSAAVDAEPGSTVRVPRPA